MPTTVLVIPTSARGDIRQVGAPGPSAPWALWSGGNPFETAPPAEPATRLALWSGSMASWENEPEGVAAPDPRTWSAAGWERFDALSRGLAGGEKAGREVLFRTHASHILSDVPSCSRFLRQWGGREGGAGEGEGSGGWLRLLLDPAAMLTASMLPAAADHLERTFSSLGPHPAVAAVVLTNITAPGRQSPLHRGVLDPAMLVALARRHVPAATPVALLDDEVEAQVPLLADPATRS